MRRTAWLSLVAAATVVGMVAAACGGGGTPTNTPTSGASGGTSPSQGAVKGGVYRTALEDFGFTGAFDPTGEYLATGFGLFSQLLVRNLVTYNHVAGLAGDKPVPDLATDTGTVSTDGLTYTFHLKQGVKFAPPVNRVITSHDIEFAFERIDTKSLVAQYGFYYDGTIVGMDGAHSGGPKPISGIETPDDNTIIFHLQNPTGDFLYRLAMPATSAMPKEVAGCFNKAGDYGRDVIASGPYMLKGSDQIDVSSCNAIKPISGFDPTKKMVLIRNPNYDPSTDSASDREANVDGISILIDSNTDDIFNKISAGDLDGSLASQPPPQVEQKYATDPSLKGLLHSDPDDVTSYITMNLLVPPFDDIHVRKAVNFALNKAAFLKAYGGPIHGKIATHIFPPSMINFPAYDPYPSPNFQGDINAAKNEMKQSKYDHNGDGVCDDPVCKNVLMIGRTTPPRVNMDPTIEEDLGLIGIHLKTRELDTGTAYQTIQTVKNLVAISNAAAWGKDYADATTFAVLFDSSGINCEGQINYSEVGMTAAQAKDCGVQDAYNKVGGNTLNVDAKIKQCNTLIGQDRVNCWIDFDKYLMENVVPWAPYIWPTNLTILNPDVTKYEFDQFAGMISLVNISVTNGISANTL